MPLAEAMSTRTRPSDYYWATAEAEECVKHLVSRREEFTKYLKDSVVYPRIVRNWEYYHNIYFDGGETRMAIKQAGAKLEKALISSNHFRSFIHLLITYTIQNRPAWDTRAVNADSTSLLQAELGNHILDYYMEQMGVEMMLRTVLEHCLVLSLGYIKCTWDENRGKEIGADPDSMDIFYEGDLHFSMPTVFDVYYDFTQATYKDSPWVMCRSTESKWNLIAKYPFAREEILRASEADVGPDDYYSNMGIRGDSDNVVLYSFYHDRTPAHPLGRYLTFVGDKAPLYDGPNPYRRKPVHRIAPADFLLTTLGYTPAFDLQGPQEALNLITSTLLTNINNLGPTKIWGRANETINVATLEPGITFVQTETELKPLNLLATPPEMFKARDMFLQDQEYLSGINSVARGQPEASLKSGAALALIDSKAMQYASTLIQAYYNLLGDLGSEMLAILKERSWSPRIISIAGQNLQSHLRAFWADEELAQIDRVVVQSGNPLMRTTAGRKEVASELLQNGLIQTPEEYLTVIHTGQTKPLTESVDAQLMKVHAENEILRKGLTPEEMLAVQLGQPPAKHGAMETDNQVLHIRKHSAILDSPETYGNPAIAMPVLAAIAEHTQMLLDPQVQLIQVALGFPTPLMPAAAPQKGPSTNGTQNKPKQEKRQVPGAPNVPGSPVGGDQSLPEAA